jgi:hypothetical protein
MGNGAQPMYGGADTKDEIPCDIKLGDYAFSLDSTGKWNLSKPKPNPLPPFPLSSSQMQTYTLSRLLLSSCHSSCTYNI